jgi:hypothetical protein
MGFVGSVTVDVYDITGSQEQLLQSRRIWDYHWYRQDSDGLWSHKLGFTEVIDVDGVGNPIFDPRTSVREFDLEDESEETRSIGHAQYERLCGCFCVPGGGVDRYRESAPVESPE